MIRLIASDIDGTLVKDSSPEMYPEMIDMIKKLKEKDIVFCAATGRQYSSAAKLFHEVKDDIVFIADNGAHIKYRGEDIKVVKIDPGYVEELVKELRTLEDCEFMCEAPGLSYIESRNESFISYMRDQYRCDIILVNDVLKEGKDIIKAAVCRKPSIRQTGEEILIPGWRDRLKVTMAGEDWVDFMDMSVDKGCGLEFVQDLFGITPEETMAFGDNDNDIEMLKRASESYAVENAPDAVKKNAKYICPSWHHKGVYKVLSNIFLKEN